MMRRNFFIVSFFLVFVFAASGTLFGQRVIDLYKVAEDMLVLGANAWDYSGYAVSYGDINGDGYMDIIIGATLAGVERSGADEMAGEVYVIFGSSHLISKIDLSTQSADITVHYDILETEATLARVISDGNGVASGDINNDGYDDLIIGSPLDESMVSSNAGSVYVIFGSSNPPLNIDLSTQSADIVICGEDDGDYLGSAVASGDVNNDGYGDIIIGARGADPGTPERYNAGKTYVIFGSSSPQATIYLRTESADITVCGHYGGDSLGNAVASGDINNDSFDDLIIGAYWADHNGSTAGETYVIFGFSPTSPVIIDLSAPSLADIVVYGAAEADYSGCAVASGDVNGDGYDDLIIGAPSIYSYPPDSGKTYVIFGSIFPSPPYIKDLKTQSANITVYGDDSSGWLGYAVASGDVNNDSYDDIILGAPRANPLGRIESGKNYVIFGSISPLYIMDLKTQSADITVYGDSQCDQSGMALASGDVNGDGYDDIIIGAPYADCLGGSQAGETYLILGGGVFITAHGLGGKSWIKELSLLGRSWGGFKAFGAVNSQGEVHLAVGEIDGDGHDEIAAGQGEGGKSWVKFFKMDGSPISSLKAFGATNTNGELHLTIGNFDADTSDNEIAIAQGEGGRSWVKVFKADGTFVRALKAFGGANAKGEVHLATGDLNKDGFDEIITGTGESSISMVKILHYWGGLIRNFKAFDSIDNPGGEVHLAVGNFDADPAVEIAAATGYNGGNKVRLFDKYGTLIGEFTAFGFGGNPNGDVQIATADIDNDGVEELICGHGEGGSSVVKVFKPDGTLICSFKAFGAINAQGEVHLGKSNY